MRALRNQPRTQVANAGDGFDEMRAVAAAIRALLPGVEGPARQTLEGHAALPDNVRVEAAKLVLPHCRAIADAYSALARPWAEVVAGLEAVIDRAAMTRVTETSNAPRGDEPDGTR